MRAFFLGCRMGLIGGYGLFTYSLVVGVIGIFGWWGLLGLIALLTYTFRHRKANSVTLGSARFATAGELRAAGLTEIVL
jgi:hypothetical protein